MTIKPREGTTLPDTAEQKARRLRELTEELKQEAEVNAAKSAERVRLMQSLARDDKWNNVQIGDAAGLTRARVSTILKSAPPEPVSVNGG